VELYSFGSCAACMCKDVILLLSVWCKEVTSKNEDIYVYVNKEECDNL